MTKYEVLVSETARRQLEALDRDTRARIKRALRGIDLSLPAIRRLKGPKRDYFRLRVGEYRVILTVRGDRILVAVKSGGCRRRPARARPAPRGLLPAESRVRSRLLWPVAGQLS